MTRNKFLDKTKTFLGGTCAETTWRDELIPLLQGKYFNPVVKDWTPTCQEIEELMKEYSCGIHLYYITSAMKDVFSIAEAVQSSVDDSKITIFAVNTEGFDKAQLKSLQAVGELIMRNEGRVVYTKCMSNLAAVLNGIYNINAVS